MDSENEFNEIGAWLFDDAPAVLRKKIRKDSFDEVVLELIDIFRGGNPNYQELAGLFGLVKIEEIEQEGLKVWCLRNIERLAGDINKIEMYIDAQHLIISKIYLYMNEFLNLQTIKQKLNDILRVRTYLDNESLIFIVREVTISIITKPDEE